MVAGCGGDDSGGDSSTSSGSTTSSESTPKEKPKETALEPPKDEIKAPPKEEETKSAETETKDAAPAAATGAFSGRIVLDGDSPELAPLIAAGDKEVKDQEVCGVNGVPNESVLVGEGNGIANVFVYLRRAPKGFKSEPPTEPVVLDQKGCIFLPHAALIQVDQPILVKSSDAVQHNVHTFPTKNQEVNLLVNPNEEKGIEIKYGRAESDPLIVKCDIHTWMSSYHLVLDHPFMALTNEKGEFQIDGLPSGEYEFRIWHETGGVLDKGFKATVKGDDAPVEIKFAAEAFATKN